MPLSLRRPLDLALIVDQLCASVWILLRRLQITLRRIKPMLPNKPRGVPGLNDRRVLNGIFWVLRSGAPWRDLPETDGPCTTCYNRFVLLAAAGVWDRIMEALTAAHDAAVQMIDTSVERVHRMKP
jgi:transposase